MDEKESSPLPPQVTPTLWSILVHICINVFFFVHFNLRVADVALVVVMWTRIYRYAGFFWRWVPNQLSRFSLTFPRVVQNVPHLTINTGFKCGLATVVDSWTVDDRPGRDSLADINSVDCLSTRQIWLLCAPTQKNDWFGLRWGVFFYLLWHLQAVHGSTVPRWGRICRLENNNI